MKDVILPKFGFTQESGEIVRWLKRDGDLVQQGEPIVEVTTDKTNMEVEAPMAGILTAIRHAEGDVVPVTDVICTILEPGEAASTSRAQPRRHAPHAAVAPQSIAPKPEPSRTVDGNATGTSTRRTIAATPAARAAARDGKVDIAALAGSGPRGRVQLADVRGATQQPKSFKPSDVAEYDVVPLSPWRRTIASAQALPQVTYDVDVDMTAIHALRERFAVARNTHIGVTAWLVKACGWALARHARLNSQLHEAQGEIRHMRAINIGVAVALDDGLIVPVIHDVPHHGLAALDALLGDLALRARKNQLQPQELTGGTFTITNLGMFGVDRFTAIINPPESAVLAAGRIVERKTSGDLRQEMTLRLGVDQRVIDGATAARFLADLRVALEQPDVMLA